MAQRHRQRKSPVTHLPADDYFWFCALGSVAAASFDKGRLDDAAAEARELLSLADAFNDDWNYGNAIHQGHVILGRVVMQRGDRLGAIEHLLAAGTTPGSPQLNSFGPDVTLAHDLLAAGETAVVLRYLALVRRFWRLGQERLSEWEASAQRGEIPRFGPNLHYGSPGGWDGDPLRGQGIR